MSFSLLFVLSASAQQCNCDHLDRPVEKDTDTSATHREKPSAAPAPRVLAPRVLPNVWEDEAERAMKAAEILEDMPKWIAEDAEAIAVIPNVKKAAFGFGGRWGKGLISARDEYGNWIPPSYIGIGGGSFGFQIGVQSTDLVLVFTDRDAVDALLRSKLTLNGDASAAAGPVGRYGTAGIDIGLRSGILAYSHNKGLFAGISLDGSVLTVDDSANAKVYGMYISGDEILKARRVESNEAVEPFLAALNRYVPCEGETRHTTKQTRQTKHHTACSATTSTTN